MLPPGTGQVEPGAAGWRGRQAVLVRVLRGRVSLYALVCPRASPLAPVRLRGFLRVPGIVENFRPGGPAHLWKSGKLADSCKEQGEGQEQGPPLLTPYNISQEWYIYAHFS